jgi:hypothetical protein
VVKEVHLQTVTEVLQSIKASEMSPMLQRIFGSEGGGEVCDVLMKYLCVPPLLLTSPLECPLMGNCGSDWRIGIERCEMGVELS